MQLGMLTRDQKVFCPEHFHSDGKLIDPNKPLPLETPSKKIKSTTLYRMNVDFNLQFHHLTHVFIQFNQL